MQAIFVILVAYEAWVHASSASIYISSPANGGRYFTQTNQTIPISVRYDLFGISDPQELNKVEFCFDIDSVYKGAKYVAFTCLSTDLSPFEITAIEAGDYRMTAVLRSIDLDNQFLETTRITNTFSVVPYDDALPKIKIQATAGDIIIAANFASSQADLKPSFTLSNGLLDSNMFTVCVMLQDLDRLTAVVAWTCLKPSDRSLVLNNLKIGSYELHMTLRDTNNADTSLKSLIKSSEITKIVRIKSLVDILPTINIPAGIRLEYGIDLHNIVSGSRTNVNIQYEVLGLASAIQQLFLCVKVTKIDESILLPFSCLSASTTVLTLSNMEIGSYTATLMLSVDQRQPLPSAQRVDVKIDIRPMIEFIPSYDWQPLHAWHTIPSGIETRLPLSGRGRKEARIPEPWRLQLTMPSPCKYFLRMDVMRDTTVAAIKEKIGEKCSAPSYCYIIKIGEEGNVLDDQATVEGSNLFNVDHKEILWNKNDGICQTKMAGLID